MIIELITFIIVLNISFKLLIKVTMNERTRWIDSMNNMIIELITFIIVLNIVSWGDPR